MGFDGAVADSIGNDLLDQLAIGGKYNICNRQTGYLFGFVAQHISEGPVNVYILAALT